MKHGEPTYTARILALLREQDDLLNLDMITNALPGLTRNNATTALHSLLRYQAVDVVIDQYGRTWWLANPEHMDTRLRVIEETTGHGHKKKPKRYGTNKGKRVVRMGAKR